MNAHLLEKAVCYHGKELFERILKQNNCQTEGTTQNDEDKNQTGDNSIEHNLKESIFRFTVHKSDFLFSQKFFPQDNAGSDDVPLINDDTTDCDPSPNNPACVNLLITKLDIQLKHNFSLMNGLFDLHIKKGEYASDLLARQNRQMALNSVHKGIAAFKDKRSTEAMLCYNKALQIDVHNVEAYVARGALLANEGDLDRAIADLEKGLGLEPEHVNANIYLKEVLLANAVRMEKNNNYQSSLECLQRAQYMDANNEGIKDKIAHVKHILAQIKDQKDKNVYGPTLPSKQVNKPQMPEPTINKTTNDHKPTKTILDSMYRRRSQSRDNKPKQVKLAKTNTDEEEDEEDLEDFFQKLKKNKGASKK